MSGYDKFWTLVICSSQLLVSKFHNNFTLRNQIAKKFTILLIPIGEFFAPACTSSEVAENNVRGKLVFSDGRLVL
jgi:hypothetical protein